MEFNQGFANFDSVYEFYYFVRKNRNTFLKATRSRLSFLLILTK